MRFIPALRKFNAIASAIVLVIAMALGGLALDRAIRDTMAERAQIERPESTSDISGERIELADRELTLYRRGEVNTDFRTDLRFVDSRTGTVTKLGKDGQHMYGGAVLGQGRGDAKSAPLGYFVLAKTGEKAGHPLFEALFLRFSDMRTFTLASVVSAADPTEVDGHRFSFVLWDESGKGSFAMFDVPIGKIEFTRDISLQDDFKPASYGPME